MTALNDANISRGRAAAYDFLLPLILKRVKETPLRSMVIPTNGALSELTTAKAKWQRSAASDTGMLRDFRKEQVSLWREQLMAVCT